LNTASKYAIRKVQEIQAGLKINGAWPTLMMLIYLGKLKYHNEDYQTLVRR
jgi:hypothetical protein